ncbi:MAG: glucosamine-6-phosphate deaminase, partial [Alphaproteobacteria bacterium]|nr:glucosamine-6-phosphate deaminase [Alphaproteobacteria bacterium]
MSVYEHKPAVAVFHEAHEAGIAAAKLIAELLRAKPNAVLGLATGSTPIGLYAELVRMHREDGLDFSRATFFNLDEYVGLPREHVASFHRFMREHLFDHINAMPDRTFIPNGMAADLQAECRRYEALLREYGPVDLQILGIGVNGHIGFNEPGADLNGDTNIVTLADKTRKDNARFFDNL